MNKIAHVKQKFYSLQKCCYEFNLLHMSQQCSLSWVCLQNIKICVLLYIAQCIHFGMTIKIPFRYFQSEVKLFNQKICTDIFIIYNISWQALYNYLNSKISIFYFTNNSRNLYKELTKLMKQVKIESLVPKLPSCKNWSGQIQLLILRFISSLVGKYVHIRVSHLC